MQKGIINKSERSSLNVGDVCPSMKYINYSIQCWFTWILSTPVHVNRKISTFNGCNISCILVLAWDRLIYKGRDTRMKTLYLCSKNQTIWSVQKELEYRKEIQIIYFQNLAA